MTRIAKRAPKRPEAGGTFVSKPLQPKKSEIEKRKYGGAAEGQRHRSNERVEEWPKRP
ncbi:hypothetical protein EV175_007700, partial [Coemansia sp. RSA 1933]